MGTGTVLYYVTIHPPAARTMVRKWEMGTPCSNPGVTRKETDQARRGADGVWGEGWTGLRAMETAQQRESSEGLSELEGKEGTWLSSLKCTVVAPDRARGRWVPVPSMSTSAKDRRIPGRSMPWHPEWSTLVYLAFLSVLEAATTPSSMFSVHLRYIDRLNHFNNKGINYPINYPITNIINKPITQLSSYPLFNQIFSYPNTKLMGRSSNQKLII